VSGTVVEKRCQLSLSYDLLGNCCSTAIKVFLELRQHNIDEGREDGNDDAAISRAVLNQFLLFPGSCVSTIDHHVHVAGHGTLESPCYGRIRYAAVL